MTEEEKINSSIQKKLDEDIPDFADIEAGRSALHKKQLVIDSLTADNKSLKKTIYQMEEKQTDLQQNLEAALEGKTRYQKEFMKANKINVEVKQKEVNPSDSFVNDLLGSINRLKGTK